MAHQRCATSAPYVARGLVAVAQGEKLEGGTVKRDKKGPGRLKGRPVDPAALAEVQALLGDSPRTRDLMVEHLHKLQDRYGCLSAVHLVALAREMRLAPTEVYEVAT